MSKQDEMCTRIEAEQARTRALLADSKSLAARADQLIDQVRNQKQERDAAQD